MIIIFIKIRAHIRDYDILELLKTIPVCSCANSGVLALRILIYLKMGTHIIIISVNLGCFFCIHINKISTAKLSLFFFNWRALGFCLFIVLYFFPLAPTKSAAGLAGLLAKRVDFYVGIALNTWFHDHHQWEWSCISDWKLCPGRHMSFLPQSTGQN